MITPRLQSSPFLTPVKDDAAVLTIIHRATKDPDLVSPSYLTQRQQLLWMCLGIYLGILALSFIVGGFDKARGGLQKQLVASLTRIASLESDLNDSRDQVEHLRGEVRVKNVEIVRDANRILMLENTIQHLDTFEEEANRLRVRIEELVENIRNLEVDRDDIRAEVSRLAPFERETNDLRPQIGPLQDTIRRKDEEIATTRRDLQNMTYEHDRVGQQYTFVQQQTADQHQQVRELRAQLRRKEEDFLRISHRHGQLLCGTPLLHTETQTLPNGPADFQQPSDAPAALTQNSAEVRQVGLPLWTIQEEGIGEEDIEPARDSVVEETGWIDIEADEVDIELAQGSSFEISHDHDSDIDFSRIDGDEGLDDMSYLDESPIHDLDGFGGDFVLSDARPYSPVDGHEYRAANNAR